MKKFLIVPMCFSVLALAQNAAPINSNNHDTLTAFNLKMVQNSQYDLSLRKSYDELLLLDHNIQEAKKALDKAAAQLPEYKNFKDLQTKEDQAIAAQTESATKIIDDLGFKGKVFYTIQNNSFTDVKPQEMPVQPVKK